MKRFVLLALCSILAFPNTSSAADIGSLIESLLQRFGASKVYSKHCVSDCNTLGYTVKESDLQGRSDCVACPFELECDAEKTESTAKWYNCPSYSCADLGLLNEKPEGVNCTEIKPSQKPGLTQTCYACQCAEGTLNTAGCEKKITLLNNSPATCGSLGYRNSVTDCENYLACPSDPNKVHCLADTCAAGQKGCTQEIELPLNATPVTEARTCCDGVTQKDVVINFTCNSGFTLSEDGENCVMATCGKGQFSGPDDAAEGATYKLEDCMAGADWLIGWKKIKVNANSTCYTCKCLLDEISGGNPSAEAKNLLKQYPYTKTYNDENLSDVACDNKHFRQCSCPINQEPKTIGGKALFTITESKPGYWEWQKPAEADIIAEPKFSSCCKSEAGDEHNFVSGFTCSEANGWVLSEDRTTCEASFCEGKKDDIYYSKTYTSAAVCDQTFGSTGWTYTAGKSAGEVCGQCKCTATTGKYAQSDSQSQSLVEYSEPICDGVHYNSCKLKEGVGDTYQKKDEFMANHPNIAASSLATVKLCGEDYVLKTGTGCNEGYEYSHEQGTCVKVECDKDVYNLTKTQKEDLEADAQKDGHPIRFDVCQSGNDKFYRLTSCGDERTNYAVDVASGSKYCCRICNTDEGFTVSLCGEGQKSDKTITSECDGQTQCYHCVNE